MVLIGRFPVINKVVNLITCLIHHQPILPKDSLTIFRLYWCI